MGSRSKIIMLCLLSALAANWAVFASPSAAQPNWRVGNNFLAPRAEFLSTATGVITFSAAIRTNITTIKCKTTTEERMIGGLPGTDFVRSMTLSECHTEAPETCSLTEQVKASDLEWPSTLVANNNIITDTWTSVKFVLTFAAGGGCPISGTHTITGPMVSVRWINGNRPNRDFQGDTKIDNEKETEEEGEGTVGIAITESAEGETLEVADQGIWEVEGKGVTTAEPLSGTVETTKMAATILGIKFTIECKSNTLAEGEIETYGLSKGTLEMKTCTLTEKEKETKCEVPAFALKFTDQLIGNSENVLRDEFKPRSGGEFGKIKISGCSIEGSYAVKGTAFASLGANAEKEMTEHELTFSGEGTLTLNSLPATLTGKITKIKLTSGKKWSAA